MGQVSSDEKCSTAACGSMFGCTCTAPPAPSAPASCDGTTSPPCAGCTQMLDSANPSAGAEALPSGVTCTSRYGSMGPMGQVSSDEKCYHDTCGKMFGCTCTAPPAPSAP